jgi:hypothetical protein
MAQDRAGVGATADAAEHLDSLFFRSCLEHIVDLLEGSLLALELIVFSFERLGVRLGGIGIELAGCVAFTADRADRPLAIALQ